MVIDQFTFVNVENDSWKLTYLKLLSGGFNPLKKDPLIREHNIWFTYALFFFALKLNRVSEMLYFMIKMSRMPFCQH